MASLPLTRAIPLPSIPDRGEMSPQSTGEEVTCRKARTCGYMLDISVARLATDLFCYHSLRSGQLVTMP